MMLFRGVQLFQPVGAFPVRSARPGPPVPPTQTPRGPSPAPSPEAGVVTAAIAARLGVAPRSPSQA